MALNEERRNRIILVIMLFTLLINFTGIRVTHLIALYEILFGEGNAENIHSLDNPMIFSNIDIYAISPEFIVIQKISLLKGSEITYKENLLFEIKFINEGLKDMEHPWFFIQILDPLNNVWGQCHISGEGANKVKLRYILPSHNKKNLGTWKIISTVYEVQGDIVTSYAMKEFQVVESHYYYWILLMAIPIPIMIILLLQKYRRLARISEQITEVNVEYLISTKSDWTIFSIDGEEKWEDQKYKILSGGDSLKSPPIIESRQIHVTKEGYDETPVQILLNTRMIIPKNKLDGNIVYIIKKGDIGSTIVQISVENRLVDTLFHALVISNDPENYKKFEIPIEKHLR